jgi:uncharacterized lipoprotein
VKKNVVLMVIVSCFVVGCSSKFSTNGEKLYLKSQNGPGLKVPPPLVDSNISPFYNLPAQQRGVKAVSIAPPVVSVEEE